MPMIQLELDRTGINTATLADNDALMYDSATGLWKNKNAGAASTNIKQTEVDFGATPVSEGTFVVVDGDVSAGSQLIAQLAYEAPTGKDLDEIDMDSLEIKCAPGSGQFTLYITATDGSYLADKFRINYLIGIWMFSIFSDTIKGVTQWQF